jgi:hypothetical protein
MLDVDHGLRSCVARIYYPAMHEAGDFLKPPIRTTITLSAAAEAGENDGLVHAGG